jgi:hypothetical protein
MRFRGFHVLSIFASSWLLACSEEDPAPLFFKIDYQVSCIDCESRAMHDPARAIRGLDGERGFAVSCRATRQGGDRIATFSALHQDPGSPNDNYGITIDQVNLDAGDPGSSCRVSVVEGNNTYEGVCAPDDPEPPNAPCVVDLELDGDVIQGSVYCAGIPNRSTSTITRHVVAPGEDAPADFEVQGCTGL